MSANEAGGYYLFSEKGVMGGFHFCISQPSRQIIDLLPEPAVAHIREFYPSYFLGTFLSEGEGYRGELFGADDRMLRFDGEVRLLSEG